MFKKVFYFTFALLITLSLGACTKKYQSVDEYHKDMSKKIAKIENISYDMSTSFADQNIKSKVFIKNNKMRTEMTLQNDNQTLIAISDGEYIINYIPKMKMATKRKAKQEAAKNPRDWGAEGLEGYQLGKQTIKNDYECQMIFGQIKGGEREFCISNKYGILVYANTKMGNSEAIINVTNIKTDKLNDNLFELPQGIKVINISK